MIVPYEIVELLGIDGKGFFVCDGVVGGCEVDTAHVEEEGVRELPLESSG